MADMSFGTEPIRRFRKSTMTMTGSILLISMIVTVALAVRKSPTGWIFFQNWVFGIWVLMLSFSIATRDRLFLTMMFSTIVMGFVELIADGWLVLGAPAILNYPAAEFKIATSPIYMPFLWASLPLCLCYLGAALVDTIGMKKVMILATIFGLGLGVFWESLTFYFHAWYYKRYFIMIHKAPLFVVLGEAVFIPTLVAFLYRIKMKDFTRVGAAIGGAAMGFLILISYMLCYYLIEAIRP